MSAKQEKWNAERLADIAGRSAQVGDLVEIKVGRMRGALLDLREVTPLYFICETSGRDRIRVLRESNGAPGVELFRLGGAR